MPKGPPDDRRRAEESTAASSRETRLLADRLGSLRTLGHRLGQRLVWASLLVLIALAFWGAHDLDRRARAARHDGTTWGDLATGPSRFTDMQAAEADSREGESPLASLTQRAVVALRLRKLQLPVRGVVATDLVDSFGDPRSGGRRHRGIDISAPEGTPVLAIDDGTITSRSTGELGGKYLFQSDDTGTFVFYYAHLDGWSWGLGEGDRVRRGDVLGYVGTTGNAPEDAPHLHFAIYKPVAGKPGPGIPINPWQVLKPEPTEP
ncbi:MAG: peptidoglycan DD-metalloendopeptidase family protein [Thermoanaerobaculia bacterium]|nr:peptidoglycan DD-metalloendopeptidase family protein [Thermoanaerobaculia bacterium]